MLRAGNFIVDSPKQIRYSVKEIREGGHMTKSLRDLPKILPRVEGETFIFKQVW